MSRCTPVQLFEKNRRQVRSSTCPALLDVRQDFAIGAAGACLDLGLVDVLQWRAELNAIEDAAAQRRAELKEVRHG
jgi:hypothetical protein